MRIEARLQDLGLILPQEFRGTPGIPFPFAWVRVRGQRAFISGQVPITPDGTLAQPLGRVGAEITAEQGYQAAQLVALAHLANLKRALGDLDRVTAWLRVVAMVNAGPNFHHLPLVANGYSDLILALYGPDAGQHARTSLGAHVPLNAPLSCEAEVELDSP
jgi:enamine deaminase RidA (YjgF/YER057c/UK114 family)